ncbi:arginyl-tRNA synthetase [Ureaplasma diversum]|uniref:Arginine--tRNA ligase n=1 Tax=Ureaplasma diversum TaxID=42094 RepID=A0A0C5S251_9BACT|nr:arginine--tRNA ligase [Ureaplasma diversum]AJQ45470.1 arginyl-tRNA synthetase [Ureaplasma diversum]
MIFSKINNLIIEALNKLEIDISNFVVDKTKNIKFGDFYSNVCLVLSKQLKKNPLEIANLIKEQIKSDDFLEVSVQAPGFLNFKIKPTDHAQLLNSIYQQKNEFGNFTKKDLKINIEYVSANPTGFLHIAHAANAIYGDTLANLLNTYGYSVETEYYINDAGNQIDKLAMSVLVRYLQLFNQSIQLPSDAYHGNEINLVAEQLKAKYNDQFINATLNENECISDQEVNSLIKQFSIDFMLAEIKKDLASIRTNIQTYTSELMIRNSGLIEKTLKKIEPYTYVLDNAKWLKTTLFGDDKDRVLVKSDGSYTYFTPDIAYHDYKFSHDNKTVDKLINIWGTDHLGYIARMKAAMQTLGHNPDDLIVVCAQVMKLTKNNEEFKLSKRSGQSLTIKELVEIIGADALRWFLGSSSMNSHVVIDVDLALSKSNNNPLYYVQYAHARANQVLNKQHLEFDFSVDLLTDEKEKELLNQLHYFKHTIANAAQLYEPHKIATYLYDLAQLFHNYYANVKIHDQNNLAVSAQRYSLVWCVKQVIANGLAIMKIQPYDSMF